MSFTDLPAESTGGPSSLALYVDTDPGAKGPEFRLATGLEDGSDFQLVRYEDWAPVGAPLTCKHSLVLDHDQAKVYASIARKCLGKPAQVRIGAKMTSNWNPEHPTTDWMKKPRGFTQWLAGADPGSQGWGRCRSGSRGPDAVLPRSGTGTT